MKEYLARYVHAVTKRLPENMRAEVKEELEANIKDMLPEKYNEDDLETVLRKLGHPRELANNYRTKQRYVISPLYYDDYIYTLKIVAIILGTISLVFGSIDAVIQSQSLGIMETIELIFEKIIGGVGQAILQAFTWVTIVFWAIDYASINAKKKTEWKLSDLPDLPKPNVAKIGRTGTVIGLIIGTVFHVSFIVILMRYIDVIAIYVDEVRIVGIFNEATVTPFIPYFIISTVIMVIVGLFKLSYGQWNIQVTTLYTAYEILSTVLFLIFINNAMLINMDAIDYVADLTGFTFNQVKGGIDQGILWITIVSSVAVGIDLVSTWIKTLMKKPIA
jgi:hypothetical protein